jgi:hypothetical protein
MTMMKILHAFWLPESTDAFVQQGNFRLWVETAETLRKSPSLSRHPRQLPAKRTTHPQPQRIAFPDPVSGRGWKPTSPSASN